MAALGKVLVIAGGVLAALGGLLLLAPKIPFLGKLPGDLHFKGERFEVEVPLATSLLISVIASVVLYLIHHVGKK